MPYDLPPKSLRIGWFNHSLRDFGAIIRSPHFQWIEGHRAGTTPQMRSDTRFRRRMSATIVDYLWSNYQDYVFALGRNPIGLQVPVETRSHKPNVLAGISPNRTALYRGTLNGALELSWSNIWSRSTYFANPGIQKGYKPVTSVDPVTGSAYTSAWQDDPYSYTDPLGTKEDAPSSSDGAALLGGSVPLARVRIRRPRYVRFASLRMGVGVPATQTGRLVQPGITFRTARRHRGDGVTKKFPLRSVSTTALYHTVKTTDGVTETLLATLTKANSYSEAGVSMVGSLLRFATAPAAKLAIIMQSYTAEGVPGATNTFTSDGVTRQYVVDVTPRGEESLIEPIARTPVVRLIKDGKTTVVPFTDYVLSTDGDGALLFKTAPAAGSIIDIDIGKSLGNTTAPFTENIWWQPVRFTFRFKGRVFSQSLSPRQDWMAAKQYDVSGFGHIDKRVGGFRTLDVVGFSGFDESAAMQPTYQGEHAIAPVKNPLIGSDNFPTGVTPKSGTVLEPFVVGTLIYWSGNWPSDDGLTTERKYAAAFVGAHSPFLRSDALGTSALGLVGHSTDNPIDLCEVSLGENALPVASGDHAPPRRFGGQVILRLSHPDAGSSAAATPPMQSGYCGVALEFTAPLIDYAAQPSGLYRAAWQQALSSLVSLPVVGLPATDGFGSETSGSAIPTYFEGLVRDGADEWASPNSWAHQCYPQRAFTARDPRCAMLAANATSYRWDFVGGVPVLAPRAKHRCFKWFAGVRTVGLELPKFLRYPKSAGNPDGNDQVVRNWIPTSSATQPFHTLDEMLDKNELPFDLDHFLSPLAAWSNNTSMFPFFPGGITTSHFSDAEPWHGYYLNPHGSPPAGVLPQNNFYGQFARPDFGGTLSTWRDQTYQSFRFDRLLGRLIVCRKLDDNRFLVAPRACNLFGYANAGYAGANAHFHDASAANHKLRILDCDDDEDRTRPTDPGGRKLPDPLRFDDRTVCATLDHRDIPNAERRDTNWFPQDCASTAYGLDHSYVDWIAKGQRVVARMLDRGDFGKHITDLEHWIGARYTITNKNVYDSLNGYRQLYSQLLDRQYKTGVPFSKGFTRNIGGALDNTVLPNDDIPKRKTMVSWDTDADGAPWLERLTGLGASAKVNVKTPAPPARRMRPYDIQYDELVAPPPANICARGYEFAAVPYIQTRVGADFDTGVLHFSGGSWHYHSPDFRLVDYYIAGRRIGAELTSSVTVVDAGNTLVKRDIRFGGLALTADGGDGNNIVGVPLLYGAGPPSRTAWKRQSLSVLSTVDLGDSITVRAPVLICTIQADLLDPKNSPSEWAEGFLNPAPAGAEGMLAYPRHPVRLADAAAEPTISVSREIRSFTLRKLNGRYAWNIGGTGPYDVYETGTVSGTGDVTLLGAVAPHKPFSGIAANGTVVEYSIVYEPGDGSTPLWEIGRGTMVGSAQIKRGNVRDSSTYLAQLVDFPASSSVKIFWGGQPFGLTNVGGGRTQFESSRCEWIYGLFGAEALGLLYSSRTEDTWPILAYRQTGFTKVRIFPFGVLDFSPTELLAPFGTIELLENYYGPSSAGLAWVTSIDSEDGR